MAVDLSAPTALKGKLNTGFFPWIRLFTLRILKGCQERGYGKKPFEIIAEVQATSIAAGAFIGNSFCLYRLVCPLQLYIQFDLPGIC